MIFHFISVYHSVLPLNYSLIFRATVFLATLVTLGSSPFAYMMWHKINKSTFLEVWMRVTHAASILVGSMVGLIALFCDTAPIHLLDAALEGFSLGTFTLTTGDGVSNSLKSRVAASWYSMLFVDRSRLPNVLLYSTG